MLLAVIRHGLRLALDRYNHSAKRRDRQLAFGLGDIVVAFFEVRAFRVGDRVRHFTRGNVRHAARRLDIRHFTGNKAVARNLHNRLCQRRAVVGLAGRFGGQHHVALVDRQAAVLYNKRHFLEVLVVIRELFSFQTHRVGARVGALRFRGAVEREVSRRVTYTFGGNRYIIPINGLFASVIRYGAIVSRNRHNHFVRDRRDFQLAFGRGNRIVDRLRIAVQLVGERVLALANVRLRARHLVRRAFAFNKAVAAYRHLVVRQRIAVVDLLVRSRGQRHFALIDRQAAVDRLRNDILSCRVNHTLSSGREVSVIGSSIRSLRTNCDIAEISLCRRTGKAGNFLLLSIIRHRVAVRRQLDVLIIV